MKRSRRNSTPGAQDRVTGARGEPAFVGLVEIEKPIYGGDFLAHQEGKAVFVPFVLPGEQVRVRVVEAKRSYAKAELLNVLTAAPERAAARCPHFGPCGGCHYQHTDYESQLRIKQDILRETLARGGVTPPEEIAVLAGPPWEYRNRVRLAFDQGGHPAYRGRRSHSLVSIRECPITAPLLVHAAFAVADAVKTLTPALKPAEMSLFTNHDETALLVTLFVARAERVRFDELMSEVRKRVPQLTGAELVLDSGEREAPKTIAQWGEPALVYRTAGADYRVDHGAFFQVNRRLLDALVDRVTGGQKGALAWDLFAGVGLFARKLADSFEKVVAVESAPAAADALGANLNPALAELGRGTPVRGSTLEFLRENRRKGKPELIVVDPPRTGLGAEVTALIAEIGPRALVYVSCDPATLARDLRPLVAAGYGFESVMLADLFPQTFHLETVVRMRLP